MSKSVLEQLKKRKLEIEARIQQMQAREKSSERKRDTRKKILVGSYYLDKAEKEGDIEEITKIMDKYLSKDLDRKLFDLSPAPSKK